MKLSPFAPQTRRAFLGQASQGLGAAALASLLGPRSAVAAPTRGVLTPPALARMQTAP